MKLEPKKQKAEHLQSPSKRAKHAHQFHDRVNFDTKMTDQIYQHEELDEFGELVSLDQHFKLLTRFFCCYTPHPKEIADPEWDFYYAGDYWNGVSNCFFVAASIEVDPISWTVNQES